MQDWDFPHFTNTLDVNLPGFYKHMVTFQAVEIQISGEDIIVGATGTVKGDIEFGNNLRTENGADIDGYIKKTHGSKSKLKPDFLFSKSKDEKKPKENGGSESVLNKDTKVIA